MWQAIASLGSGLISGLSSLFGSNKGNKAALQAVEMQNQANKELAEYSYQKDLEMWERQNVYNSPMEQMNRLTEAGLNPNLMYGQGNTGNASSMPSYDAPKMEAYTSFGDFGVSHAGQALMSGLMNYAQVKKINAEADNIRQNTSNMEVQKQLTELQLIQQGFANAKSKVEADNWMDLYRSKIANMDSSTVNNFAHGQLADSQRFYTDAQKQRFELLTPLVQQTVKADLGQKLYDLHILSPAKLKNLQSDTAYKDVISKLSSIKSELLFNDLEYSNEQNKYVTERAYNDIQNQRINIEIKQLQKKLTDILYNYGVKPDGSISSVLNSAIYLITKNNYYE